MTTPITEDQFETALAWVFKIRDQFEDGLDDMEDPPGVEWCATFKEAEILTNNRGVVVVMTDGSEFQITIVQSRPADD